MKVAGVVAHTHKVRNLKNERKRIYFNPKRLVGYYVVLYVCIVSQRVVECYCRRQAPQIQSNKISSYIYLKSQLFYLPTSTSPVKPVAIHVSPFYCFYYFSPSLSLHVGRSRSEILYYMTSLTNTPMSEIYTLTLLSLVFFGRKGTYLILNLISCTASGRYRVSVPSRFYTIFLTCSC